MFIGAMIVFRSGALAICSLILLGMNKHILAEIADDDGWCIVAEAVVNPGVAARVILVVLH